MKSKILAIALVVLMVVGALVLASCGEECNNGDGAGKCQYDSSGNYSSCSSNNDCAVNKAIDQKSSSDAKCNC